MHRAFIFLIYLMQHNIWAAACPPCSQNLLSYEQLPVTTYSALSVLLLTPAGQPSWPCFYNSPTWHLSSLFSLFLLVVSSEPKSGNPNPAYLSSAQLQAVGIFIHQLGITWWWWWWWWWWSKVTQCHLGLHVNSLIPGGNQSLGTSIQHCNTQQTKYIQTSTSMKSRIACNAEQHRIQNSMEPKIAWNLEQHGIQNSMECRTAWNVEQHGIQSNMDAKQHGIQSNVGYHNFLIRLQKILGRIFQTMQ